MVIVLTVNGISPTVSASENLYPTTITGSKTADEGFTGVSVAAGSSKAESLSFDAVTRYFFYETKAIPALIDKKISVKPLYNGHSDIIKFYADIAQSGAFGSPLAQCAPGETMADITLPESETGFFRCRLEADDCVADFLLNLHHRNCNVVYDIENGSFTSKSVSGSGTIGFNKTFTFSITPNLLGFADSAAVIRHGHNLDGPQYVSGNRQWSESVFSTEQEFTLESENVDGDIYISANLKETPDSEWTLIWSDEFDAPEMNTDKWKYCSRSSSTWSRLIAKKDARGFVNKFEDGYYNSYCIPKPAEVINESQKMISGAINSQGLFYLTGGRIEARIKTTPHTGNFPAFWMMPQEASGGWPQCGEIDIWEQIDNKNTTYHTVHTGWEYQSFGKPSQIAPPRGGTGSFDQTEWHVYTLEWDQNSLRWYVDNKHVFTYQNMHFSDENYPEDITWPFNKPFYIILNQSVGNGGWAANFDPEFTYKTSFDYVRCYQKKDALDYYTKNDGHVTTIDKVERDHNETTEYFDLQGRKVYSQNLKTGLYIKRKGSVTSKVLIR